MSDFLETACNVFDIGTPGTPEEVQQLNQTCSACGSESVWRASRADAYRCRSCDPPATLPVAEVIGSLGKLSVTPPPPVKVAAWLEGWAEIAAMTQTVPVQAVQAAMSECDAAFEAGDLEAFRRAARKVEVAVRAHMNARGKGEAAA
jgi:hypothetical protein